MHRESTEGDGFGFEVMPCTPMALPSHRQTAAAFDALFVRTDNAPALALDADGIEGPLAVQRAAIIRGKRWPVGTVLRVQFLDGTTEAQDRLLAQARRIAEHAALDFVPVASGGDIRVSFRRPGLWSNLGTDARLVSPSEPTLNLQGFDDPRTPEAEWPRAGLHELFHAVGAEHEQSRREFSQLADVDGLVRYWMKSQGWDFETASFQYAVMFGPGGLIQSDFDPKSLMMYPVPRPFLKDPRHPVPGGLDADANDWATLAVAYPGRWTPPKSIKIRSYLAAGSLAPPDPGAC